jgi:3-oxoacyl-[acyl-carrier protein] reductase
MQIDLTGKTALVTGSSRGIGRAIAGRLAAHGARVAVHYRADRTAAEATLAGLAGEGHAVVAADLADPSAAPRLVAEVVQRLGGCDILVNNAGIYEMHPFTEATFERWQAVWRRTLDINLLGAAHVTFCAAQQMIACGGGRIVSVSSRGAFRGEPDCPAYGASKAGLNALSQSLAQALAKHNISVAVVAPGFVATDMTTEMLAGPDGDAIRAQSPFGRVASPEEVAGVVVYLASDQAEFLSGTIVDVNGASYLRS